MATAKFMQKDYHPGADAISWFKVDERDYGVTDGADSGERLLLDCDGNPEATLDADGWVVSSAGQDIHDVARAIRSVTI